MRFQKMQCNHIYELECSKDSIQVEVKGDVHPFSRTFLAEQNECYVFTFI